MIPILYGRDETEFTSNGMGRLVDCISCTVTEERNGIYECQFTYPISGEMYSQIQEGCIVGVIHDDVKDVQPFDIYGRSAPLAGVVTFFAHHISYRLSNIVLKPMSAPTCAAALAAIPGNVYTECPFTFWTDKDVVAPWTNVVPNAVRAILGGQQGSILDVYGKGEYEFDKWLVRFYTNRGVDNGVSIRYGVNLTDMTHDIDTSGYYTAVVPFWRSEEDGTVVTLPEGYVRVNLPYLVTWTDNNGNEMVTNAGREITFNAESSTSVIKTSVLDLTESFEEQPTVEQLRQEASRRLINSDAWLPDDNIRVSFIDLADTDEYRDVAALQRVRLCDRVNVYCGPLGVNAVSMQVISTTYNTLTERYDVIELGKARTSFAESIMMDVADAVSGLPSTTQIRGMLDTAIDNATDLITGANGGHVRFIYDANGEMQEILVMDTDSVETAVNIWRWNQGGLGFSSHGYAGPYGTAITQDGRIVADMISTGILNANLIGAGVVQAQFIDGDNLHVRAANIDGTLTANKIVGGTLTLGGFNNQYGTFSVVDKMNELIGVWDSQGVQIMRGGLHLNYAHGGSSNYNYSIDIGDTTTYPLMVRFTESTLASGYLQYGYGGLYINHEENVVSGTTRIEGDIFIMSSSEGDATDTRPVISLVDRFQARQYNLFMSPRRLEFYNVLNSSKLSFIEAHAVNKTVDINGTLTVSGTKSRSVTTDQYSDRLLYCYETPTPMFGDIGEGVIAEDGLCYVWLDPVFAKTITTDQYQVFIQRYGAGDCYVQERRGGCFIVSGTPGLEFGWEVKAKQRNYDQLRLDRAGAGFIIPEQDYGLEAAQHIDQLRKEREVA